MDEKTKLAKELIKDRICVSLDKALIKAEEILENRRKFKEAEKYYGRNFKKYKI